MDTQYNKHETATTTMGMPIMVVGRAKKYKIFLVKLTTVELHRQTTQSFFPESSVFFVLCFLICSCTLYFLVETLFLLATCSHLFKRIFALFVAFLLYFSMQYFLFWTHFYFRLFLIDCIALLRWLPQNTIQFAMVAHGLKIIF